MSDVEFPLEVQRFLQLEDHFGLSPFEHQRKKNTINFIKHVENIQKQHTKQILN